MELATFILIGRSGCGKGTQSRLLEPYLRSADPERRDVLYLETGEHFRDFFKRNSYSSKLARELNERSELQPPFLAIHFWSDWLIEHLHGSEHLIIDGTPRYLDEARALTGAMRFYRRRPTVIHLNVPREFSEKHLRERGRADDRREGDIQKRLLWFETSVLPAIEYLKHEPLYRFIEVNGNQPIEKVHADIVDKLA